MGQQCTFHNPWKQMEITLCSRDSKKRTRAAKPDSCKDTIRNTLVLQHAFGWINPASEKLCLAVFRKVSVESAGTAVTELVLVPLASRGGGRCGPAVLRSREDVGELVILHHTVVETNCLQSRTVCWLGQGLVKLTMYFYYLHTWIYQM